MCSPSRASASSSLTSIRRCDQSVDQSADSWSVQIVGDSDFVASELPERAQVESSVACRPHATGSEVSYVTYQGWNQEVVEHLTLDGMMGTLETASHPLELDPAELEPGPSRPPAPRQISTKTYGWRPGRNDGQTLLPQDDGFACSRPRVGGKVRGGVALYVSVRCGFYLRMASEVRKGAATRLAAVLCIPLTIPSPRDQNEMVYRLGGLATRSTGPERWTLTRDGRL